MLPFHFSRGETEALKDEVTYLKSRRGMVAKHRAPGRLHLCSWRGGADGFAPCRLPRAVFRTEGQSSDPGLLFLVSGKTCRYLWMQFSPVHEHCSCWGRGLRFPKERHCRSGVWGAVPRRARCSACYKALTTAASEPLEDGVSDIPLGQEDIIPFLQKGRAANTVQKV